MEQIGSPSKHAAHTDAEKGHSDDDVLGNKLAISTHTHTITDNGTHSGTHLTIEQLLAFPETAD